MLLWLGAGFTMLPLCRWWDKTLATSGCVFVFVFITWIKAEPSWAPFSSLVPVEGCAVCLISIRSSGVKCATNEISHSEHETLETFECLETRDG